jgi:hypothetical protein
MKLPFSLPTDNYILIGGIILIVALAFVVTFFMSKRSAAVIEVAASRESGQSTEGQAPPMNMQQEYSQDQLDPVTGPREEY